MLALLAKAEYPKAPLDLQLQIGWLALLFVVMGLIWAWSRSESLRRAIFAREDPRLFALFRIGLGLMTIQNFWNLLIHWRMLWTDEGMFTGDEVRSRFGRSELAGWNEIDGFIDGWAVLKFFWGKHSLLFIKSSPDFVILYLVVLFVVLGLYTIGFRSRVTAVLALLLINSIYNRNMVYHEGHDTVFRTLWFLSIFAQTDKAWSVDNWLRRKREARLKARTGPKAAPFDWMHFFDRAGHWLWGGAWAWLFCAVVDFSPMRVFQIVGAGVVLCLIIGVFEQRKRQALLEAGKLELRDPIRFQLITAWPRYLIIMQLVCIYFATGLYKTGSVWKRGDALYYALNMDHFYRFEGFTQWTSALFSDNLFRLMTWVTWFWERGFPLILLGLVLKWGLDNKDKAWYRAQESVRWRKWLGRLALIGGYFAFYRLNVIAYPWCLPLRPDKSPTPPDPGLINIHTWYLGIIPVGVAIWFVLGRWPLKVKRPLLLLRQVMPGKDDEKGKKGKKGAKKDEKKDETKDKADKPKSKDESKDKSKSENPEDYLVIDQRFIRNWLFGRRIWLGLGVMFHGILFVFMNIGMFPLIMMWIYVVYFRAEPMLKILRACARFVRRSKFTRWMAPKLLDEALVAEKSGVLETPEEAVERDPTGPWWLDPWKLFVGPIKLIQKRKAGFVDIEEGGRERGGRIPDALVLALGAVAVTLVVLRGLEAKTEADLEAAKQVPDNIEDRRAHREAREAEEAARNERIDRLGDAAWWWAYAVLGFAAVSHFRRRNRFDRLPKDKDESPDESKPEADEGEAKDEPKGKGKGKGKAEDEPVELAHPTLIPGTLMRTIVLGFMVWHIAAVATLFTPRYTVTQAWRSEVRKPFGNWVRATNNSQSWKMFSPNPPRGNTFMRTVVFDQNGEPYQVGNDHYTNRPYVFWFNDRMRKMHRRMVGKSKWYLKYWSQYHCRDWAFTHDGQLPEKVEVLRLNTPIPKPDKLDRPSDPRKRTLRQRSVNTYTCKETDIHPFMKQRRDWPLTDQDERILEAEERRMERAAEGTRRNWAKRTDFGGVPLEEREAENEANENKRRVPKSTAFRKGK